MVQKYENLFYNTTKISASFLHHSPSPSQPARGLSLLLRRIRVEDAGGQHQPKPDECCSGGFRPEDEEAHDHRHGLGAVPEDVERRGGQGVPGENAGDADAKAGDAREQDDAPTPKVDGGKVSQEAPEALLARIAGTRRGRRN